MVIYALTGGGKRPKPGEATLNHFGVLFLDELPGFSKSALDSNGQQLLELVFKKMKLSARGYNRVLKVARTIADLDGRDSISTEDLAEALQYRKKDLGRW